MRQEEVVLEHLRETGWITSEAALNLYGIQDLPKRISELRFEGHRINKSFVSAEGRRFIRYALGE